MLATRVFPTLLIRGRGLYKGVHFRDHRYVGDPVNAVRIFNDREVDEIAVIDIDATPNGRSISVEFVRQFAAECFMPLTVGGGIATVAHARQLLQAGAEKVLVNSAALARPTLVRELAETFGSSSVVVAIDCKRGLLGRYKVMSHCGQRATDMDPVAWAMQAQELGAGELLVTAIDRDGDMSGYDCQLLRSIAEKVSVPVIAAGGCGSLQHMRQAVDEGKVAAVTGGSYFVFHGPRRAVLISFPSRGELESALPGR